MVSKNANATSDIANFCADFVTSLNTYTHTQTHTYTHTHPHTQIYFLSENITTNFFFKTQEHICAKEAQIYLNILVKR